MPKCKKVLVATTVESKIVLDLTVDDARDMYAPDATVAFCGKSMGKGKKLYIEYNEKDTNAIPSEDNEDR